VRACMRACTGACAVDTLSLPTHPNFWLTGRVNHMYAPITILGSIWSQGSSTTMMTRLTIEWWHDWLQKNVKLIPNLCWFLGHLRVICGALYCLWNAGSLPSGNESHSFCLKQTWLLSQQQLSTPTLNWSGQLLQVKKSTNQIDGHTHTLTS